MSKKRLLHRSALSRRPSLRRLRVELMEDRLMLSGSSLDLSTPSAIPVPDAQPAVVTRLSEGGYLTFPHSQVTFTSTGNPSPGAVLTDTSLQGLIGRGTLVTPNTDATWQDLDSGIQPVSFGSNSETGLIPRIDAPFAEPQANWSGAKEGGPIPIAPILARAGSLERLAANALVSGNLHKLDDVLLRDDVRPAAASKERSVTAEWARAAVFELAGGEPSEDERGDAPGSNAIRSAATLLDGSLSNADKAPSAMTSRTRVASDQEDNTTSTNFSAARERTHHVSPLVAGKFEMEGTSAGGETSHGTAHRDLTAAGPIIDGLGMDDVAHREAFAQLSGSGKTKLHWLAQYSKPAVNASPLLLLLALDRITARKVRQAAKQALPKSPRAWRSPAGAGGALPAC